MTDQTQATASTTPPADAARLDPRDRLVITILLVSAFIVILNETIMGVALPRLMEDLRIDASAAQWLSTAFMLTMAVVIPITGFLLQRFNTKPVFIAAMSLFSVGTLIAAISPGFPLLVVARVIQASGTAIMMPLLFTTVITLVPVAMRGRVMGNISIVISVAPAIGPTISGVILSVLDWRWMFILVLPIAVAGLIIGGRRMVNVTEPSTTRFDILSVIVSAFGFGGLVYGLSNLGLGQVGWTALAIGLVALVLFVWRQLRLQRTDSALLDLRTFTSPTFAVSIGMSVVSMVALFGTIILLPIFVQNVLGLAPLTAGLMLLPGGLIMGLLAPTVGRIYDRIGPRPLVVTGSIIVSGALWGMTMFRPEMSLWWIVTAHVILSLGLAMLFTPLFTASLGSLTPKLYSHGSAVLGTVQQVSGAAGTALFVTVMAITSLSLQAEGIDLIRAEAEGIRVAFTYGAVISLLAIPAAFFVRKPADSVEPAGAPAH